MLVGQEERKWCCIWDGVSDVLQHFSTRRRGKKVLHQHANTKIHQKNMKVNETYTYPPRWGLGGPEPRSNILQFFGCTYEYY